MALDYSKLSDEELEAIANDDYSKLSDNTLRRLSRDPGAQTVPPSEPDINVLPQVASGVKAALPEVAGMAQQVRGLNAVKGATANIRDALKVGSMLSNMPMDEYMQKPITNTAKLANAYVAGHPYTQAVGNVARGAGKIGGALVRGALAPESAVLMPYQMAAYEQEKIRVNPDAPGLEYNPYAQTVRGEAATQSRAGAANQMRTVANMPYGNVSPQERAILDQDRQMKEAIRKKALERVMGPVAPGPM